MSDEPNSIKESIETLNYLLTQMIVELKQLNDNLQNLGFLQANRQMIQKEQQIRKREEGFKGDAQQLQAYLKEMCPTLWAHIDDVKILKSGDFLVTFSYMSSNDFEKASKEVREKLNGYYSKKYRGFIIPAAGGGKE